MFESKSTLAKALLKGVLPLGMLLAVNAQNTPAAANNAAAPAAPAASTAPAAKTLELGGVLVPRKAQLLQFKPKLANAYVVESSVAAGSELAAKQSVIKADLSKFKQAFEDAAHALASAELEVAKAELESAQLKLQLDSKLEKAAQQLLRARQNLEDFQKVRKELLLAESEQNLEKMKWALDYQKEELRQLERVYKDDQFVEDSEKMILTRTKNELKHLELAQSANQKKAELFAKRDVERGQEDLQQALKDATLANDALQIEVKFALQQNKLKLEDLQRKLQRAQNNVNDFAQDQKQLAFAVEQDGVVVYGGMQNGRWQSSAQLQRAGSKLEPYALVASVVPKQSSLYVLADLPDGQNAPKPGDVFSVQGPWQGELQATVKQVVAAASADSKRQLELELDDPKALGVNLGGTAVKLKSAK